MTPIDPSWIKAEWTSVQDQAQVDAKANEHIRDQHKAEEEARNGS